jgi:hypothetical protein
MTTTLRPAVIAIAALALLSGGCGSNNTGKIVGRWKGDALELGPIGPKGLADIIWEFREDGSYSVSRVPITPPGAKGETVATGRYTLEPGDRVTFSGIEPPEDGKTRATETIIVDGDTMTMGGGAEKRVRFTRLTKQ